MLPRTARTQLFPSFLHVIFYLFFIDLVFLLVFLPLSSVRLFLLPTTLHKESQRMTFTEESLSRKEASSVSRPLSAFVLLLLLIVCQPGSFRSPISASVFLWKSSPEINSVCTFFVVHHLLRTLEQDLSTFPASAVRISPW